MLVDDDKTNVDRAAECARASLRPEAAYSGSRQRRAPAARHDFEPRGTGGGERENAREKTSVHSTRVRLSPRVPAVPPFGRWGARTAWFMPSISGCELQLAHELKVRAFLGAGPPACRAFSLSDDACSCCAPWDPIAVTLDTPWRDAPSPLPRGYVAKPTCQGLLCVRHSHTGDCVSSVLEQCYCES